MVALKKTRPMKSEVLVILALAAALCFHRNHGGPACGSSGCLLLAPDFRENLEALRAKAALPQNEGAVASRVADR